MPEEYVLIFHVEEDGLVHAVPLTEWVSLTTCSIRIHIRHYTFAPLPFIVYLRKELLEERNHRKGSKRCRNLTHMECHKTHKGFP